jgi:hypothetical protein
MVLAAVSQGVRRDPFVPHPSSHALQQFCDTELLVRQSIPQWTR